MLIIGYTILKHIELVQDLPGVVLFSFRSRCFVAIADIDC